MEFTAKRKDHVTVSVATFFDPTSDYVHLTNVVCSSGIVESPSTCANVMGIMCNFIDWMPLAS